MKKLIEILNQFEKEKKSWFTWRSIDSYDNCVYGVDCDWETEITMYSDLYSKWYGFIKWLVDNDKIDDKKLYSNDYRLMIKLEWESYWELWWADRLIMILSVKDSPIDFLCSILK
jgi:hypothetical protein